MPVTHNRALHYTAEEWRRFDKWKIDPMDGGQVRMVAGLLQVSDGRVHEAIRAVGTRCGDIRRRLTENPSGKKR